MRRITNHAGCANRIVAHQRLLPSAVGLTWQLDGGALHWSAARTASTIPYTDLLYNAWKGRTTWRGIESAEVEAAQTRFWADCLAAEGATAPEADEEAQRAASTIYSQLATVRLAIAVFLAHARMAEEPGRRLRIVLLGASTANEYARPLHGLMGLRGGLGELLARAAGSCAEPGGEEGADGVGLTAPAVDFLVCGPQVPAEAAAGPVEHYGRHTVVHRRGALHEHLMELDTNAPIDLCVALHAGFNVPRYKKEWAPTLALLAARGAYVAASAYDATEDAMNREALEEVAKAGHGDVRFLRVGPSPAGALIGKATLGKLNYALTVAHLPGPAAPAPAPAGDDGVDGLGGLGAASVCGYCEAVAAVRRLRADAAPF